MSTTPTVTIITAVHRAGAQYLHETWESIKEVWGSDWEWVLQQDSTESFLDTTLLPEESLNHPQVRIDCNEFRGGVAITRNLALIRSKGQLVVCLDGDDRLASGIQKITEALLDDPSLGWGVGSHRNIIDEHSNFIEVRPSHVGPGTISEHFLYEWWAANERNPFAPAMVAYRTSALWEAGGWPALHMEEDLSLLFAVNARHPGVIVDTTGWEVRRWPHQTTANEKLASLQPLFAKTAEFHRLRTAHHLPRQTGT